jgi:hypothetical protein
MRNSHNGFRGFTHRVTGHSGQHSGLRNLRNKHSFALGFSFFSTQKLFLKQKLK